MTRVVAGALGLLLALPPCAEAQATPSLDEVMARATAYLRAYSRDYAATIADEHYSQSAAREGRVLDSEFGILRLPGSQWLGFRDVVRVDGSPVRDREARLARLFADAASASGLTEATAAQATRVIEESVRFNIGAIQRTINSPALVLELLDPTHHGSFEFSKGGDDTVAGIRAWRIKFVERARPTIIRTLNDGDVPALGDIWIDPDTGRLLRADVTFRMAMKNSPARRFDGFISITFKEFPGLAMWLPEKMIERYQETMGRPVMTGLATYSNYRRFRVESQENIELPPPAK
jgi:hypothetical protein